MKSGHGFELTVRFAYQTDNHMAGPRIGETFEKLGRTVSRTSKDGLAPAPHLGRLPVVSFEKRVDPLRGAAGVLVDRQGHINRGHVLASIAPRFAKDLLHLAPLLRPAAEVGLVGEPAIEMPGRPLERRAD